MTKNKTREGMIQTIILKGIVSLAQFIQEHLNDILGIVVVYFFISYFFIKDWDKILLKAAKEGDLVKLEHALLKKANINAIDNRENNALILAVLAGHLPIISRLLEDQNIKIDKSDEHGRTALYIASEMGHLQIVKLLLLKKADTKSAAFNGYTSLLISCGKLGVFLFCSFCSIINNYISRLSIITSYFGRKGLRRGS
jgi:hypothetical protein